MREFDIGGMRYQCLRMCFGLSAGTCTVGYVVSMCMFVEMVSVSRMQFSFAGFP